ncbi:MAG TPA: transposase [Steroidobacteraceae bacterium]|jgi:hypothetical protein
MEDAARSWAEEVFGQADLGDSRRTRRLIETHEDVHEVVSGYTQRWKIEELHRTWKSGACRVEETQLRTADAVMKWAIITAANTR